MRYIILICCFYPLFGFNSLSFLNSPYFIYIQPGDKLFQKKTIARYKSIDYLCNCYARKDNPHFESADTNENYLADTLPSKHYSMLEFVKIANKVRTEFKNRELATAPIFLIEKKQGGKYHYYKAIFLTIEGDD